MTNADELRELFYSSQDPQFRDEEAETRRIEKDRYLDDLRQAYDAIDEAKVQLTLARWLSDSPMATKLLGEYVKQLDTLNFQLEKLL